MATDKEKSPMDYFEDESEEQSLLSKIEFLALLVIVGPLGLIVGPHLEEQKVFLWGVGTTLLYVGTFGFFTTISVPKLFVDLGLEPYLTTVENAIVNASEYIYGLFSMPATYIILFAIGVAIVLVGCYRIMKWEPEDDSNGI